MRLRLAYWVALALALLLSLPPVLAAPGSVYMVLGSDTAVWNVYNGIDASKYHNHFSSALYTQPQNNAYQVMDPAFRQHFADSYGHPLKMTWWMLVGNVYGQADNTDVPIANLMPLYLMRKYHGAALQQFGDELTLHYHTFYWSDYNGDGVYWWNEAQNFHLCRGDFDLALAQSLLEEGVFPVSFRSGWHYMDNEWQQYLNQLLPYSMDDDWPGYQPWYTNNEPIFNVLNWSQAPSDFVPFNPSPTNYQVPGDGLGWNVRSVKLQYVSQALMNQIFAAAAAGTNEVASLWGHLPESGFLYYLGVIDAMAHTAAANYPTVPFVYCTAVEAMQRWRGTTDQTPPQLDLYEQVQGATVTLLLHTDKAIFQPQPFVALKDIYAQYSIVPCQPAGTNSWAAVLSMPRGQIAKYGVAVTDLAGNLTTRIVRYLPDDLFIDNLDAGYQEVSGPWVSTTNAAWGIDARIASLAANTRAEARWGLPITWAGSYNTFVQVPAVDNAAGQVEFDLLAGGSNVLSVFFANPLPANQWVYLGTPLLDPAVTNVLAMLVSAQDQTNRYAVADVVKLSPLILPLPGFIRDVQVEPYDTTANLTWRTPAPATTLVEYGPSPSCGSFSATNSQPLLDHVATLTGLKPGTPYYFRAKSTSGELEYSYQGSFTTTNFAANVLLFDVVSSWKYNCDNLDGAGWQAPGYNDSAWPGGPGLLWVDTRTNGPNPAVGPRNTQMPANPATGYPFITYYFRKHFSLPPSVAVVSLTFSNYIDDGAAFYLNGGEVHRNNLPAPPTVISNHTLAVAFNCQGDATCPVLFSLAGNQLTNLLQSDNVLAVEVHNYSADSPDLTFGSALYYAQPYTPLPELRYLFSGGILTLYWNGDGFTLQQAGSLAPGAANWTDVPGPSTASPCALALTNTTFFRLKK